MPKFYVKITGTMGYEEMYEVEAETKEEVNDMETSDIQETCEMLWDRTGMSGDNWIDSVQTEEEYNDE